MKKPQKRLSINNLTLVLRKMVKKEFFMILKSQSILYFSYPTKTGTQNFYILSNIVTTTINKTPAIRFPAFCPKNVCLIDPEFCEQKNCPCTE